MFAIQADCNGDPAGGSDLLKDQVILSTGMILMSESWVQRQTFRSPGPERLSVTVTRLPSLKDDDMGQYSFGSLKRIILD